MYSPHVPVRTKGQVNTGRYRFLVLGGGYIWIVTQATVISGQRESAPSAIVCLHYVISGVEQPGLVLSCVQLLPSLCSSPLVPPPSLEGAGADSADAAEGILAMTVTALPNTNSSASSSHSSGKHPLKLVARSSPVLFKPASPSHLIPNSGPHNPNLDDSIVSDAPSLPSLDPSFCTDQPTSETAPYLVPATSLTSESFTTFEGSCPSYQSSASAVGELQSNSSQRNAQSSGNTDDSFFGISLNVNVASELDSSSFCAATVQSRIISTASQITQPAVITSSPYDQSTIVSTPLLERETGSSPLLSQSAAGVWDVKSFSKSSVKEEGSPCGKKECPDTLLSAEPLSLEQYLFPDSSCDSGSLDLFEDIQQQSPPSTLDENMDFIDSSPFLKTEEFFEGDCIEGCAPLLHLNEDESLIMWSPGTDEPSSSSSSSSSCSNDSSLSSSPCKRSIDSCDGVFSRDSGFDGGLFSSTDEREFESTARRVECFHRDSSRRSSFSELLQLSSSPPLKYSGDAPASCIDPNTVWPGLHRSQPLQGDKPLDFEQLLQEDDDEPSSCPTLASVLSRDDPCGTPRSSSPPSSSTDQTSALMHPHSSPKPPRKEYKTRPFTVPLDAPAVYNTRLLAVSAQEPFEEPPVPSIKRPSSPYETRQLATRKRVCAAHTPDDNAETPSVLFKSSRPLIKPNMPCVEQLLVSKCVPDKNSQGGMYNKNQSHSVLRNLLVSGHDSSKEHYVLPLSPAPSRDRSPQPLSKGSLADPDSADDPPDTSSPPPRARTPLSLATRSFRSSRHSKASIVVEAVSSSAEDSKPHDSPKSPTPTSPTLLLHSNSLGRMKVLRLAPTHRSVYATRAPNGRLQLFTQRAPAKIAQSVVLEDCATSQSVKSNPVLVKSASAITAPYALHFCSDAATDYAHVLKLKGYGDCAGKKVLLKRRANKEMTASTETPCKRQLLVSRETAASTPISWLSLSPSGRWTAAGDHRTSLHEPTNKHRIAKSRVGSCGERGGTSKVFSSNGQNQHSECLFMEDSDSPSVTIVPFL
ncbi:PAS domain [Trinorchestia longiramus]|nr:PAS domain [Trinorchestia longiramus]